MCGKIKEIKECEVCGNSKLVSVLDLGEHPLCDDLVPIGMNERTEEYPIEILHCNNCQTSHQRYQVEKRILFPRSYHYRSRFTADVINGMKGLVEVCQEVKGGLEGLTVLDIGCNDGTLLKFFKVAGIKKTIGVEPTNAIKDGREDIDHSYNTYFDENCVNEILKNDGKVDIITMTNVFAHIEDINRLIMNISKLVKVGTLLVIENHYLGSVLAKNQFDTFYHEHPRTYSVTSFKYIAKKLGMELTSVQFPARYGGNIRVIMKKINDTSEDVHLQIMEKEKNDTLHSYKQMGDFLENWKTQKKNEIINIFRETQDKIYCKAFPGRAAILIKLLGLDEGLIHSTFEKPGSSKIGNYIPGTRIPILSDHELNQMNNKPKVIINLAWHISEEIRNYLKSVGYHGLIVDIL